MKIKEKDEVIQQPYAEPSTYRLVTLNGHYAKCHLSAPLQSSEMQSLSKVVKMSVNFQSANCLLRDEEGPYQILKQVEDSKYFVTQCRRR